VVLSLLEADDNDRGGHGRRGAPELG